jgi:hypothetical protein
LPKDRVADADALVDSLRHVVEGGTPSTPR